VSRADGQIKCGGFCAKRAAVQWFLGSTHVPFMAWRCVTSRGGLRFANPLFHHGEERAARLELDPSCGARDNNRFLGTYRTHTGSSKAALFLSSEKLERVS